MKKKDINSIYCVYCGTKNNKEDKKCTKCNKKLNPKNHLLKEYLVDHIKDDIKCNIEDSIFELIKDWLISHLFGVFTVAALIFLPIYIIINEANLNSIKSKFANVNYINYGFKLKDTCEDKKLTDEIDTCPSGYTLSSGSCIKTSKTNANKKQSCPSGYTLTNGKCLSDKKTDPKVNYVCDTSGYKSGFVLSSTMAGDHSNCMLVVCSDDTWNPKGGTSCPLPGSAYVTVKTTYTCSDYKDSNGKCRTTAKVNTTYSCSKGTLKGTQCETTTKVNPTKSCPKGYTYDKSCKKCALIEQ